MKKVEISYNPYKMETVMYIDGINVTENENYKKFKKFIEQGTPLQTWIEPILYLDWEGFVNELSDKDRNDEVLVEFSGRKIDFDDFQRSIENQNKERDERTEVVYTFNHKKKLDDKVLSNNIDDVVKELKSKKFRSLVESRTGLGLNEKYNDLEENYRVAKESDFYIVIAGVYSSGKSTFLNTLIRHTVLPTSTNTCTSKNCRIRHDGSLGNKISLSCYDSNDKRIGKKYIFENDADCASLFKEICPIDSVNEAYEKVETMELGVDLSHLYPESVSKDKFTIVLIDTPGMDSAQSSNDGINTHAEIALEAISMESKPMIILCSDANKYEDDSIGEFMREIIAQAKEDGGGFNDRFLFLMNQSDRMIYNSNELAEEVKENFAGYLTDSSKWKIKGDDNELKTIAENASHFVPRVFMISALASWAIQNRADLFSMEELKEDSFKRSAKKCLDTFIENVCVYNDGNYYLSTLCDIPNYQKDAITTEFESVLDSREDLQAAELQCGLISVERTIKDYIERYAYPVKVRGLLGTFEDILEDVDGFTNGIISDLKKAQENLGKNTSEQKEAEERKQDANEKIAVLEKAKEKANKQLSLLDEIKFDSVTLKKAIADFGADIDSDNEICFIRNNNKVTTGQKSHEEVLKEITCRTNHIKNVFDNAIQNVTVKLNEIKNTHDKQLLEIFDVLKVIVKELEESEVFKQGDYNFANSVSWKADFAAIDSNKFAEDLKKKVVDKTITTTKTRNMKKRDWSNSWNPFKKIGSWFMDDYTYTTKTIEGYYDTTEIQNSIDKYLQDMSNRCSDLENKFNKILEIGKQEVRNMTQRLINELQYFLADINTQEERIKSLSESIQSVNEEIENYAKTQIWLSELKNKIKGE